MGGRLWLLYDEYDEYYDNDDGDDDMMIYLWFTVLIMVDCNVSPARYIIVSSFGCSPSTILPNVFSVSLDALCLCKMFQAWQLILLAVVSGRRWTTCLLCCSNFRFLFLNESWCLSLTRWRGIFYWCLVLIIVFIHYTNVTYIVLFIWFHSEIAV